MNAETLSTFAAGLIALALAYAPFLNTAYGKLTTAQKAGVFAGLVLGSGLGAYGLACSGWVTPPIVILGNVECSQTGFYGALESIFGALKGGAATYVALVRPFKK